MIPKRYFRFLVLFLILYSLVYLASWGRAELTTGDKTFFLQSRHVLDVALPPKPQTVKTKPPLQYVPYTSILITKNADFAALGFPGEGTQSDPYVIEGLNITSETETQNLIAIQDTTAYFLIRNNLLNGTRHMKKSFTTRESYGYGIYLYNAVHGTIDTNIITNCSYGIYLHWKSRATVANNIVSNNTVGIYLHQTRENTVTHNAVSDCWAGIFLESSEQSTLIHNTISNCFRGFYLWDSEQNSLLDNTMLKSGLFIHSWLGKVEQASVENNTVNGKPLIFWQNVDGGTVPPDAGQIILVNSNRIEITEQNLSHTSIGVHVINSTNLTIHHNTFFNNSQAGIHLHKSWNNTLTHNTVSNCEETGIYLEYSGQSILTHNTVSNCEQYGISLYQSEQSTLTHNIVSNSEMTGIYLDHSGQSSLTHNTVSNCREAGIYLGASGQNTIVDNMLINNGLIIYGNYIQTNVLDNVVNGSPLVFWQQVQGGTVPPGAGQIILINSTGVEVTGQNLSRASVGLFAAYSSHLEIHHNTISQNTKHGIWLFDSWQTTVSHNVLSQNGNGIDLWNSLDNIVAQNIVSNCEEDGIRLFFSNNDTVTHNTVSNCDGTGIRLDESEQSTLTQNIVSNCERTGIYLVLGSRSTLQNNTIINNTQGILLLATSKNIVTHNTIVNNTEYGIALTYGGAGKWRVDCKNNTIKGNDFLGNNLGGSSQGNDNCTNNVFVNNYWDDHDNTDLNADGIADDPYPISGDATNQDLTPLTTFTNPHRLLAPTLIFPNGGEAVHGMVTLHWTPVFDAWGHSVTYTVSYSADDGQTWIPLVVGLTFPSYEWDTTKVADGSTYRIMVVATCSDGFTVEDHSDAAFTIQNQPSIFVSEFTVLKSFLALGGLGLLLATRKRRFG